MFAPDAPISAPLRTSSSRRSRRSRDHYGSTPQGIFPINEPLDIDSLEHSENDHLVTDGVMDPSSKDFEKHYDMLHDIEVEKDVYRLRVCRFGYNVVNGICTKAASGIERIHLKLVVATQVTFLLI